MNWDAIDAIGQLLGVAVVAVSLLYLARQIRQNASATKASNRYTGANLTTTLLLAVASDGELASLFRRGQVDPTLLDDDEAFRFESLLYSIFDQWETFHSHWRLGALSDDDWEKWASIIGFYMSQKGSQEFWRNFAQNFSSAFREYVDGVKPQDHGVWRNESVADARD